MGYICHHAIVVTATYSENGQHWAEIAHAKAVELAEGTEVRVTEITPTVVNDTRSFMVAPDGSKEGWEASDEGDKVRELFVRWMIGQDYEDGSNPLNWVVVQFGDENGYQQVLHASR